VSFEAATAFMRSCGTGNMVDLLVGFENVDKSAEQQSFFQFPDLVGKQPSIAKYRARMPQSARSSRSGLLPHSPGRLQ
jgi:hypothetical protein